MSERTTSISQSIEYETAACALCDDDVFVDDKKDNIENMPEGVPVVIGGGKHMSVNKTDRVSLNKDHWQPEVLIKWFTDDEQDPDLTEQYLCPSCTKSLYK
ncbi:hypothetical protein [Halorubrum kocurii]|uniref:hypothetical protein n=1 Tax=Halorubrum kocurii TaxID=478441 RepID=UPI0012682912|nr:hypothetical protein [Halorubrum kocurii]